VNSTDIIAVDEIGENSITKPPKMVRVKIEKPDGK
jgi:ribosomal protein L31E